MSADTKKTRDHSTIKRWAEERNGKPARVKGTETNDAGAGLLRINFPGYAEENLENINWDSFFKTFDEKDLTFLYQDETKEGSTSRFCKFVNN